MDGLKILCRQLGCLATLSAIGSSAEAAREKPNTAFILADNLNYGDLGGFGQAKPDAIAEPGLRSNQFYTGRTVCAPSP